MSSGGFSRACNKMKASWLSGKTAWGWSRRYGKQGWAPCKMCATGRSAAAREKCDPRDWGWGWALPCLGTPQAEGSWEVALCQSAVTNMGNENKSAVFPTGS